MFKNIQSNVNFIVANKKEIISLWMDYEVVQKTLKKNSFNVDFFEDKFASKVFDYAINVVKSKDELGDCPVIGAMLMLFKKKKIPLTDIFLICVNFKNAFLQFSHTNTLFNKEMIDEISMLMDYNFEGVISGYTSMYYNDVHTHEKHLNQIETTIDKKDNIPEIETKSVDEKLKTSASEYILNIDFDIGSIEELDDLEIDTLNTIEANEYIMQDSLVESSILFENYAKVIRTLYEFKGLSYTLVILKDLLAKTEYDMLNKDTKKKISFYLKSIISDLQTWRISIFVTKEAEDIHYLDKTLMSSIAQLQMILMPEEANK